MNHGIAVKSFIINSNNELLLIKRRSNDVHSPGQWDIPGAAVYGPEKRRVPAFRRFNGGNDRLYGKKGARI